MKKAKLTLGKPPLLKMFYFECLFTVLIAVLFFFHSIAGFYSALLGGLIAILSNMIFSVTVYQYIHASAVHKMLRLFYLGEIFKLMLAALLLASVFKWVNPLSLFALFSTLFIILLSNSVLPVFMPTRLTIHKDNI